MRKRPLHRRVMPASWGMVIAYGVALAAGVLLLQWIEYQHFAFGQPGNLPMVMLAILFLGLGIWVGAQLFRRPSSGDRPAPDGNPQARAALGISQRETEVLALLAEGHSNKEIARALGVSPNTVKTHIASLFTKLEARRRTEAIQIARQLRLVP